MCAHVATSYRGNMEAAAFKPLRPWRVLIGVAALVLAADQISKSLVVAVDPGGGGGLVSVRLVRNTGASFGIGAGHPVLIALTAAAVLAVAVVLLFCARSRVTALFLAAVLGGAAGNLADRLFRSPGFGRGAVVDWIHVAGYPATFNVADVAIRVGALGAAVAALVGSSRGRRTAARVPLRPADAERTAASEPRAADWTRRSTDPSATSKPGGSPATRPSRKLDKQPEKPLHREGAELPSVPFGPASLAASRAQGQQMLTSHSTATYVACCGWHGEGDGTAGGGRRRA